MADADLRIVISGDSTGGENAFRNIATVAEGVGLERIIENIATQVINLGQQFIQTGIAAATNIQFIANNLDNLTGSTAKTNAILGQMKDLTDKGLFKPEQVDAFTQKLLQMHVPQNKVVELMHSMAAATIGSSTSLDEAGAKMNTLVTLFGYMQDKGGLTVSMLGRFSRSLGIPIVDAMAKSLGMTTDQFEALKGKTTVTAELMEKAFKQMTTGSGEFAKSMTTASTTVEAKSQALKVRFEELAMSLIGVEDNGNKIIKGGIFDNMSQRLSILISFIDKNKQGWIDMANAITKTLKPAIDTIIVVAQTFLVPIFQRLQQLWQEHRKELTELGKAFGVTLLAAILTIIVALSTMINIVITLVGWFLDLMKIIGQVATAIGKFATMKINIPAIPHFAAGTSYASGGMSLVGENGPELVNLPQGAQVMPTGKTQQMLGQSGGVNVTINNPVVRSQNDITSIVQQVKQVLGRQLELSRLGAI